MFWISLYAFPAIAVGVAAFLFAECVREPTGTGLAGQGILAALNGFAWPVIAVGLAQLALLVVVQSILRVEEPTFTLNSD